MVWVSERKGLVIRRGGRNLAWTRVTSSAARARPELNEGGRVKGSTEACVRWLISSCLNSVAFEPVGFAARTSAIKSESGWVAHLRPPVGRPEGRVDHINWLDLPSSPSRSSPSFHLATPTTRHVIPHDARPLNRRLGRPAAVRLVQPAPPPTGALARARRGWARLLLVEQDP